MARPRKLTKVRRKLFLEHYGRTGNKTLSAEAVGVKRMCVYRALEEDPEFVEQLQRAPFDAMTPKVRTAFLDAYEGIGHIKSAADQAGVSIWTIEQVQTGDEDFAQAMAAALEDFKGRIHRTVVRRATVGDIRTTVKKRLDPDTEKVLAIEEKTETYFDPQCLKALRELHIPAMSPPQKLEVSGPGGGAIPVDHRAQAEQLAASLTYEQLRELRDLDDQRTALLELAGLNAAIA